MTEAAPGDDPVEPATEAIPEPGKGPEGSLPDILAIIESAKARDGIESMERFVAKALPDAEAEERHEKRLIEALAAEKFVRLIAPDMANMRDIKHPKILRAREKSGLDGFDPEHFPAPMGLAT